MNFTKKIILLITTIILLFISGCSKPTNDNQSNINKINKEVKETLLSKYDIYYRNMDGLTVKNDQKITETPNYYLSKLFSDGNYILEKGNDNIGSSDFWFEEMI
jgi:hypothetical protein